MEVKRDVRVPCAGHCCILSVFIEQDAMPSAVPPRASISKDSGIESNLTSRTKGQRCVSESEESFHTCHSNSALPLNGR